MVKATSIPLLEAEAIAAGRHWRKRFAIGALWISVQLVFGCTERPPAVLTSIVAGSPTGTWEVDVESITLWPVAAEGQCLSERLLDSLNIDAEAGVYVDRAGTWIIGNRRTSEVVVVPAGDGLPRTLGRPGAGPGEFRTIRWVGFGGADTLLVFDSQLGRLTALSLSGELLWLQQVPQPPPDDSIRIVGVAGFIGRDLVLTGSRGMWKEGRHRTPKVAYRWSLGSSHLLRLVSIPGDEIQMHSVGGQGLAFFSPLFKREGFITASGTHIFAADNAQFEVLTISEQGEQRQLSVNWSSPKVTGRRIRDAFDSLHAEGQATDKSLMKVLRAEAPSHAPVIAAMSADESGHLWVKPVPNNNWWHADWLVIEPAGQPIARVPVPLDAIVTQIGEDYLVVVRRGMQGEAIPCKFPLRRHGWPVPVAN